MMKACLSVSLLLVVMLMSLTAPMCANAGTTPNAFTFISQDNMPTGTLVLSNSITVTGIDAAAAISISGGQYAINSGGWTSSAGTVNNGDTVTVGQMSSSSNSTLTTATLTIGGVSGAFNVTTAASGDPNASGLVAWWRAENNAYDSLGNYNGSPINGSGYAAGKVGQAFSLDGSSQAVAIPDGITPYTARYFTISAWVNANTVTGSHFVYFQGNSGTHYVVLGNGIFSFAVKLQNSGWQDVASPATSSTGVWYHVVGVRRGASIELWVNGELKASNSIPDENLATPYWAPTSFPARIGAYHDGTTSGDMNRWSGLIDEVKVFNRALSPNEIGQLYGTTPISFSFNAQTGMPLNTTIISNPITITGIDSATAISITGGEYQVNGGSWTSSAGTVNNSDKVTVRQTSSSSYSTMTTANLTIGGVSGAFNVTTAASDNPNANGLVAWWKAENNAYDSIGGNNGTMQGGATYTPGKVGLTFSLDGSSGYVQLTDSSALKPSYLTVEAWINLSSSPSVYGIIFDNETGPPSWDGYELYVSSANKLMADVHAGSLVTVTGTTTLQLDTWYHVALTYDGSTIRTYINGVLDSSAANTGVIDYTSSINPRIGMRTTAIYGLFPGLIDEVKIFSRALSAGEIAKLYGTVPDAFSFIAQTGMPLNTTIVSNPITITGISYPIAVLISGGEYQVNGGSWISSAGTVNNSDTVTVRQTSSISNSTLTTATLTVGDASAAFNVTTAASGDPNASGLTAWWKAENNAYDSVGGNHGTAINGATYATGKVGQAFSFDGIDDYVEVPNFITTFTQFSFSFWMNITSFTDHNYMASFCQGNSIVNTFCFFAGDNSGGTFGFEGSWQDGSYFDLRKDISFGTGVWKHIAVTYDGSTLSQYVDGVLDNHESYTGKTLGNNAPFIVGKGFAYPGGVPTTTYFNGFIDEVKIFNRALSSSEVGKLSGRVPDAFSFIAQTAMPVSTIIVSNPITVTGISAPTAISITGGEYSISTDGGNTWGTWASSAGTVSVNNQVMVRQTSSASNSTMTTSTLTIGTVSAAFNVTTAASGDPNASGLVAWWRAENNAYDSVGGNNGTLQGGTAFDSGKVGQAFSLDGGAHSYVSVPNNSSIDYSATRSFEMWIYPKVTAGFRGLLAKGYNSYSHIFSLWDGHLALYDGGTWRAGTTVLSSNVWYHVAFVQNGPTVTMYLNGVLDGTANVSWTSTGDFLEIGSFNHSDFGDTFNGLIDEVKIYNRALSATEVSTLTGKYTLTISKDGTGSGTVTSSPAGIDCGSTCSYPFDDATHVDISASASDGSTFYGWSGGVCSGNSSPCNVVMDADKSVTATFKLKADFDAAPKSGQAPMAVQFTDLSVAGATTWYWEFGDGSTSTLQNPVHMYKTTTGYPVSYNVSLTANGSKTTKNNFITLTEACSSPPYKIGGTSYSYSDVQSAYEAMGSETMQMQALVLSGNTSTGNLMLDQTKTIKLQGGYDCGFTTNPGVTIINDKLTIKGGKVTIEKLIIK